MWFVLTSGATPVPAEGLSTSGAMGTDSDLDGIFDSIDPHPGTADPMRVLTGDDYTLTLLGSGRVVSLESAAVFNATSTDMNTTEAREIATRIYEHFRDDFDFIIMASNQPQVPSGTYSGRYQRARNDVEGIGTPLFDGTQFWGSNGRLRGAVHLTATAGLRLGPSLHELEHAWGNAMPTITTAVSGHWGYSNIGGQLGGWLPGSLEDLGGGQYRVKNPVTGEYGGFGGNANGGNSLPYAPFELYTMGLIAAGQVGHDIKIANDFAWNSFGEGIFSASSITTLTMDEIVASEGLRAPGPETSPKSFRMLYVILTPTPLPLEDWRQADQDVHDFELDGEDGTSLYNFWEATGGRATADMASLFSSLIDPGDFKLESISFPAPHAEITLDSLTGRTYTLQYSSDLEMWHDGEAKAGDGDLITLEHDPGTESTLYFRVRRE